jgi:DNA-binding phage protein
MELDPRSVCYITDLCQYVMVAITNEMNAKQLAATNRAIKALGGITKTAKRYGISVPAVQNWRTRGVPKERVKDVEKDSGVSRAALLPNLYA